MIYHTHIIVTSGLIHCFLNFIQTDCPHYCRDTKITQYKSHTAAFYSTASHSLSVSSCVRSQYFLLPLFSQGEEAMVLRKCFEGVQRDGDLIRVRDTVLLKSGPRKKTLPYVAKISALWEEPESGRKQTVTQCLLTPQEMQNCFDKHWMKNRPYIYV